MVDPVLLPCGSYAEYDLAVNMYRCRRCTWAFPTTIVEQATPSAVDYPCGLTRRSGRDQRPAAEEDTSGTELI